MRGLAPARQLGGVARTARLGTGESGSVRRARVGRRDDDTGDEGQAEGRGYRESLHPTEGDTRRRIRSSGAQNRGKHPRVPRIIGLTGGIASGKSTVAKILRELGAPIVDADQVARDVVEPGTPALEEIVARFGPEVVDADGRLERKRLGDIVFADDDARAALNAIIHPRIAAASQQRIAALAAAGEPIVVYEAALIVENKLTSWMEALIVVSVSRGVQVPRLMARDGIDAIAAEARLAAQLPLEDKVAVADYVVDNSGTLEQTRAQVERLWARIKNGESA